MKRFIFIISLFILLFVSSWSILLHYWEQYAYSITTHSPYKRINFATNYVKENPDLVILGNSRAECSYNDSILSADLKLKCVNFGWAGYPFDYQYNVMWKTYLKNNNYPKYVLLEVGPWAFFDYVNPIYIVELLPYIDRPEFQFYMNLCPELSYRDGFLMHKYRGKITKIHKEYRKLNRTKKKIVNKKWNPNYLDYLGDSKLFEHDPQIISTFDTFVNECKQNNITLICICSPIHTDDCIPHFEMDSFWNVIHSHATGENVYVLNYQNYYGNDTTFFSTNGMHLGGKTGKEHFSKKVAHDLDSLGIIK